MSDINVILKIENLCVTYRSPEAGGGVKQAVRNLNLSVQQGEVFGFSVRTARAKPPR